MSGPTWSRWSAGKQFRALCERVMSEAAFPDEAKKKLAEDDRSIALLSQLTTRFTKLNQDVMSHFTELDEDAAAAEDDERQDGAASSAADERKVYCAVCGAAVKRNDVVSCTKMQGPVKALHQDCTTACKSCAKSFCSADCQQDHGCHCGTRVSLILMGGC